MVAPVALITPCRNRAEYVIRSLPCWLACPQVNEILIVDFNSTPAILPQLAGLIGASPCDPHRE